MERKELFDANSKSTVQMRRNLLPWWIKVFAWIFIVIALLVPVIIVFAILGYPIKLSLYGLYTESLFSIIGIFLTLIFLLKGITGYAIWMGKNYAINLALTDAVIGIIASIYVFSKQPTDSLESYFPFELLLFLPYIIKLTNIRREWSLGVSSV